MENQDLTVLYNNIIQGLQFNNYHELLNVVKRICNLIPEFSLQGARTIDNYSQKELEDIVIKFIKKVQKLQVRSAEKAATWGDTSNTNFTIVNEQKKAQALKNWNEIFKQYYDLNKNNLKMAISYLNNGEATDSQVEKIENCLYALDLYQYIIYNATKKRFEFILQPDIKSGGQYARKLTLPMFKQMISAKLPKDALKITNKQELANVETFRQLIGARQLHPNVRQTDEYKFFVKLIEKINLQRKYAKVDRFIKKSINAKTQPSTSKIADKLFSKFKSFGKRKINDNKVSVQTQQDQNLYKNQPQDSKDPFLPLSLKYQNVKVLDKFPKIEELVRAKQQKQQSLSLLKNLEYVPQADKPSEDIVKTAANNIPNITRKVQTKQSVKRLLGELLLNQQLTQGIDVKDTIQKKVRGINGQEIPTLKSAEDLAKEKQQNEESYFDAAIRNISKGAEVSQEVYNNLSKENQEKVKNIAKKGADYAFNYLIKQAGKRLNFGRRSITQGPDINVDTVD